MLRQSYNRIQNLNIQGDIIMITTPVMVKKIPTYECHSNNFKTFRKGTLAYHFGAMLSISILTKVRSAVI